MQLLAIDALPMFSAYQIRIGMEWKVKNMENTCEVEVKMTKTSRMEKDKLEEGHSHTHTQLVIHGVFVR